MEDPVRVFGRSEIVTMYIPAYRHESPGLNRDLETYLNIPGTECHINEISWPPDGYNNVVSIVDDIAGPMAYWRYSDEWRLEGIVLASMSLERHHLVCMIDRCIAALRTYAFSKDTQIHPVHVALENWKKDLVLERIRRNMAARTIQRQFRESMSNPGFRLCKQRLLREFAEGI